MKNQRSQKPEARIYLSVSMCHCYCLKQHCRFSQVNDRYENFRVWSKIKTSCDILWDVRVLEKSSTRFLRTKQTSPPLHNANTYSEQKTVKDLVLEMVVELAGQKKHMRKIKRWRKEMDSTETEPSDCGSPKRMISSFRRPISSSTFIVMALCFWLLRGAASSLDSRSVFVQAGGKRVYKQSRYPFKISIDVQRRDPQKSRGLHPYP